MELIDWSSSVLADKSDTVQLMRDEITVVIVVVVIMISTYFPLQDTQWSRVRRARAG